MFYGENLFCRQSRKTCESGLRSRRSRSVLIVLISLSEGLPRERTSPSARRGRRPPVRERDAACCMCWRRDRGEATLPARARLARLVTSCASVWLQVHERVPRGTVAVHIFTIHKKKCQPLAVIPVAGPPRASCAPTHRPRTRQSAGAPRARRARRPSRAQPHRAASPRPLPRARAAAMLGRSRRPTRARSSRAAVRRRRRRGHRRRRRRLTARRAPRRRAGAAVS